MATPRKSLRWILLAAVAGGGCAGVHDRQVLNPSRDWRMADTRRERVARLKAPFVKLGSRLRSLSEPAAPTLAVDPLRTDLDGHDPGLHDPID